jgi:hypothetical protein
MTAAHKFFDNKDYTDILLRSDYRVIKNEEPDVIVFLNEFTQEMPDKVRDFVLSLHQRYANSVLRCRAIIGIGHRFIYFHNNTEIFSFESDRILIKAEKIKKFPETLGNLTIPVQDKINRGYGCEKKLYGLPCQHGCHGFNFSLDDSILDITKDIETWLDKEVTCLQKRGNC